MELTVAAFAWPAFINTARAWKIRFRPLEDDKNGEKQKPCKILVQI